ncbi:TetR family transcriptional regulator [Nocardiopsis ganjiahuensis]|uniref:TetR family transcriptional regulator n=1 Tax=Nocardiopsis ganjiahuensis TaxID=239984 RepID=UPI00038061A5|nr:TetR family transcriptional regulator [Nocardiopsis ganjiahuensis]
MRTRVLEGAVEALCVEGAAKIGADGIARRAGVSAAVVWEHFGGVEEVVAAAVEHVVRGRVRACGGELAGVRTVGELVRVGRSWCVVPDVGSVGWVVSQVSGSVVGERAVAAAVGVWSVAFERVLVRVLAQSPVQEFVDAAGLGRMVVAALVGAQVGQGAGSVGAERALEALEQVGELVSALHVLGPESQRAVRIRLRHAGAARGVRQV